MCRFVQHRLTTFCVTHVGKYFNFDQTSTFATDGQVLAVTQCRNGISVWSGNVTYWTSSNEAGSTGDAHGRRESGSANDQWEICDIVTTASSCPSTTTAPTTSPTAPHEQSAAEVIHALESALLGWKEANSQQPGCICHPKSTHCQHGPHWELEATELADTATLIIDTQRSPDTLTVTCLDTDNDHAIDVALLPEVAH